MYKNLDDKISRLASLHIERTKEKFKFYPRVMSQTDILFTEEEQTLLNKGIKYNLNHKTNLGIGNKASKPRTLLPYYLWRNKVTCATRQQSKYKEYKPNRPQIVLISTRYTMQKLKF